ncbi:hypothetical protein [Pseudomonas kurunegalensis]|uniref:hypothetical protein n=1 Tax=Pseudomonas kurunegalensis TaxID=485880 RepID=UPI0028961743|nr:hypothetical protein [Pseudomonas kurunegalensis]MDT3750459.1 hypothetical protein [Pseudomonas kurunegalensis]
MASLIERARPAAVDPAAERVAAKVAAEAPDSGKRKNVRGKREMFSVGLEPEFLTEVDAFRERNGNLSRPALIKIALRRLMDSGL